jgi:hypothetical protein
VPATLQDRSITTSAAFRLLLVPEKKILTHLYRWGLVAFALFGFSQSLTATTIPISGVFSFDNDVVFFRVTVPDATTLTVYTTSAFTGGFAPFLAIFGSAGALLNQFNGGEPTCANGYSNPRPDVGCNDTYVQSSLDGGTYFIALSQTFNNATGDLGDPFTEDGEENRNYTNSGNWCGAGTVYFCDAAAGYTADAGNWTVVFDAPVLTAEQVSPEPASLLCFAGGAGALFAFRRRLFL